MRSFSRLFIVVTFLSLSVLAQELKWYKPAEGFALAARENKMVLLDAYTDWCVWCKVMDTATYAKSNVVEALNSDFVAIKYNPEKDGNIEIAGLSITPEEFGKKFNISGYPATAFFTSTGEFIQTITGYIEQDEFLTGVIPFIKSGDAHTKNYRSMQYLANLDEAAKQGVTSELVIAYAIIYLEVEGDTEKALAKLSEVQPDDPNYDVADALKKYVADPMNGRPEESINNKIKAIVEKYLQ